MSNHKFITKLSSVSNLHDARYGAGMLMDMLGFCLSPDSPDHINEETFIQIAGWVTGIALVLEVEGQQLSKLEEKVLTQAGQDEHHISYIQVRSATLGKSLSEKYQLPIILKIDDLSTLETVGELSDAFRFILIEGTACSLSEITALTKTYPILLGTGVNKESIAPIMAIDTLAGIAFKGGKEEQVGFGGYQDFDEVSDVLEFIEDYLEEND